MFNKFLAFLTGFLHNVVADPVSSGKGLVSLAAAAGLGYAMATGGLPPVIGIPLMSKAVSDGVHALGTNNLTGVEAPAAVKIEAGVATAAGLAPVVLSLADQVAAMKLEASAGQSKVDAYAALAESLAGVLPPAPEPKAA